MSQSQGDIDRGNNSATLIRCVIAFLLFLPLAALVVLIIFSITDDFGDASDLVRNAVKTDQNAETSVLAYLGEARGHLIGWTIASLASSWILASLFLSLAQRREPRDDDEAKRLFGIWGLLLIATALACALLWWRQVSLTEAGANLLSSNYVSAVTVCVVATLAGYWIATALVVKHTLKPSVPFASALPSLRR